MLTVAPSAADAISKLVTSQRLSDDAGLRIVAAPSADTPGHTLRVNLEDQAAPADQVIDEGDAHVFVDAEVADELDDRTLEAAVEGKQIRFALSDPTA